jgi:hypothetical protein
VFGGKLDPMRFSIHRRCAIGFGLPRARKYGE